MYAEWEIYKAFRFKVPVFAIQKIHPCWYSYTNPHCFLLEGIQLSHTWPLNSKTKWLRLLPMSWFVRRRQARMLRKDQFWQQCLHELNCKWLNVFQVQFPHNDIYQVSYATPNKTWHENIETEHPASTFWEMHLFTVLLRIKWENQYWFHIPMCRCSQQAVKLA